MDARAHLRGWVVAGWLAASAAAFAAADPVIENARQLLAAGNAKQAYAELIASQDRLSGMPEFDSLLGVAGLVPPARCPAYRTPRCPTQERWVSIGGS